MTWDFISNGLFGISKSHFAAKIREFNNYFVKTKNE